MGIIGGTVFVVKDVEIQFDSGETMMTEAAAAEYAAYKEAMLEAIDLKGKNILFNINERKIRTTLESTVKLIKVKNIEAEFPNRVVIKVRERFPIYIYRDEHSSLTLIMDTDMRVLKKNPAGYVGDELVDISYQSTSINFSPGINEGDFVSGQGDTDKEKLEQIGIIQKYFFGRENYEAAITHSIRKITFAKPASAVSSMMDMDIEVRPDSDDLEAKDIDIRIIKSASEDFARLLSCVWATVETRLEYSGGVKWANQSGQYTVYYKDGRLEVLFKSGNYEAKFVEGG
jgi:hypothetical protein